MPEPLPPYLAVLDLATRVVTMMTLDQAEATTGIDRREIEAAIEAVGVCQSMDFTIRDTRPAVEIA